MLFKNIVNQISEKWPDVTDDQLVSFINRLDELQMQKSTGLPIYINGYSETLSSQGFPKAAKAALFAKSGLDRKNALPRMIEQKKIIKKLYHKQEGEKDIGINFTEKKGAHHKCLNKEGEEYYRCLEDAYIEVSENKRRWPFDFRVRLEIVMWKLKRSDFDGAIKTFEKLDNEINQLKISYNFQKLLTGYAHRGFWDIAYDMYIGQDIQNLDKKYFTSKQCIPFIESNPDIVFIFESDPQNNTKYAMASILIKCLVNLPLETTNTYLQGNKLYKENGSGYFSSSFIRNVEYAPENIKKMQLFLKYPRLTSKMSESTKKLIKNGYHIPKKIRIIDKPLKQALEEISKYDDLDKQTKDISRLMSANVSKKTPDFPNQYQTCKIKY